MVSQSQALQRYRDEVGESVEETAKKDKATDTENYINFLLARLYLPDKFPLYDPDTAYLPVFDGQSKISGVSGKKNYMFIVFNGSKYFTFSNCTFYGMEMPDPVLLTKKTHIHGNIKGKGILVMTRDVQIDGTITGFDGVYKFERKDLAEKCMINYAHKQLSTEAFKETYSNNIVSV